MRVETAEGVLVVYDAASPPQAGGGCSGYLAYWLSAPDETQYVFPGVLDNDHDLSRALLALERDLGVDLEALADADDRVDAARRASAEAPKVEIVWEPVTLRRAVEIMGFEPGDDSDPYEADDGQTAGVCDPCYYTLEPPSNCGSPSALAEEALSVVAGCCGGCSGCCRSPDPCCGSTNPCCGNPDPCCGNPDPCCSTSCPPDHGCPQDWDCDGLPDDEDPDIDGDGILNGDDPDVDGDGIANDLDPDGDGDGIPDWDDPSPRGCLGPCCGSSDPCCGHDDPCAPVCGDPCSPACVDCDDGDDCTADSCDEGDCVHICNSGMTAAAGEATADAACANAFSIQLLSITFKNSYPIWPNGGAAGWELGALAYDGPAWKNNNNPNQNHPAAFRRATKMRLSVRVAVADVADGTAVLKVAGPDGINGQVNVPTRCARSDPKYVTFDMTSGFPDVVWPYEPMPLVWSVTPPGATEDTSVLTTYHNVYVIYEPPQWSNPTPKRLSTVCNWAAWATTADEVALKVWEHVGANDTTSFSLSTPHPIAWDLMNPWALLPGGDRPTGDCRDLANLMRHACGMIGVPGSVGYVYATRDNVNFSTSENANETVPFGDLTEKLGFFAAGDCNRWEAVCVVNNHYYAVKVSHDASSLNLLKTIVCPNTLTTNYQCWAYIGAGGKWFCDTANPDRPVALPSPCP